MNTIPISKFLFSKILFGTPVIMMLFALLFNQIFLAKHKQYLNTRSRIRRINFNHTISILIGISYAIFIFYQYQHHPELTIYDKCIIIIIFLLLLSGIFAFLVHIILISDKNAFILKIELQKESQDKNQEILDKANLRCKKNVELFNFELSKINEDYYGKITFLDLKFLQENPQFKKFDSSKHTAMNVYRYDSILELPSKSILHFATVHVATSKGESIHYKVFISLDDQEHEIYTSADVPTNVIWDDISKEVYLTSKTIDGKTLKSVFSKAIDFEKKLLEENINLPTINRLIPVGVLWYYVLLIMMGNKIDYIIPLSRLAKFSVFILMLFRFITIGFFVGMVINGK